LVDRQVVQLAGQQGDLPHRRDYPVVTKTDIGNLGNIYWIDYWLIPNFHTKVQPRVDNVEKGESIQLSIYPHRTSLHHRQRFCKDCF